MMRRREATTTRSDGMKTRKILAGGTLALGVSVLGLGLTEGPASAHHPNYGENCTGIHASGTDYPQGSHVTLKVDGTAKFDEAFDGGGFTISVPWDQTKSHTFSLVVFSPDGIGLVNWSGTQVACVEASTTMAPEAPTTVVPVATTLPEFSTPNQPVTPPTTAPPTVDSTPQITNSVPPLLAPPVTMVRQTTTTAAPALPSTGSSSTTILAVGVAALLVGGALLLAGRRGSAA
jgi:LPXTG-motif cell wall-anchored protein